MLESLLEPFSYSFMIRSFLISIFVGISLPMIGSFVINRNLGFMGDAIAHASLPVLVIGAVLGASVFLSAIPAAIIIAVTLSYIISRSTVGEDTAIGIVFSTFFAVGIILLKRYNLATTLNIERYLIWTNTRCFKRRCNKHNYFISYYNFNYIDFLQTNSISKF